MLVVVFKDLMCFHRTKVESLKEGFGGGDERYAWAGTRTFRNKSQCQIFDIYEIPDSLHKQYVIM